MREKKRTKENNSSGKASLPTNRLLGVFCSLGALCATIPVAAGLTPPSSPSGVHRGVTPPPVAERITNSLYRVGGALVDTQARTVTCKGSINMDQGAIEYLAVAPHGKLYESLLRVDVRPMHLQVALLLLGLEPRNVLRAQGDTRTPEGDPVRIRLRWRDEQGVSHEARAEEWVVQMPKAKPMPEQPWVFTGSRILAEGFQADLEQSLVAVWHDPAAILDNRAPGGADNAYVVRSGKVPRHGTPVEFVIQATGPVSGEGHSESMKAAGGIP